jgi:transposase
VAGYPAPTGSWRSWIARYPAGLDVHVICDNSSTHKTEAIGRWLVRHPRFHLHFTPSYSSWLNLVER